MITINLDLTLKFLLYILSIIFFLILILTLLKIKNCFSKIDSILKNTKDGIEESVNQLPILLENSNKLLEDTNSILKDSKNNIIDSTNNISLILESMKIASTDVVDSTKFITENLINKTTEIKSNINNVVETFDSILKYIELFRAYLKKK